MPSFQSIWAKGQSMAEYIALSPISFDKFSLIWHWCGTRSNPPYDQTSKWTEHGNHSNPFLFPDQSGKNLIHVEKLFDYKFRLDNDEQWWKIINFI